MARLSVLCTDISYRPVKVFVLVVFEKCCPHKNVGDLDVLGHTLCVGLAGTYSAQNTTLVGDGVGSLCRGVLLPDSVECIFEIWRSFLDVLDNSRVIVVEDMSGSELLDQIKVSRAASGDDVEAIKRSNLNGILSDTRYTQELAAIHISGYQYTHNYHPRSRYSS